mmetsp:Transcript_27704/g.108659  ORF Transcript_27704/g.108659 Transcript_27704/m.108659 type:complete len:149 (-) Transcript_27704:195-641(-)
MAETFQWTARRRKKLTKLGLESNTGELLGPKNQTKSRAKAKGYQDVLCYPVLGLQQTERLLNNLPRCDFIVVNRNLLDEFENHGISRKHHRATENTKGERKSQSSNCLILVASTMSLSNFLWSYPADSGSGCQCGEVAMGRVVELGLS